MTIFLAEDEPPAAKKLLLFLEKAGFTAAQCTLFTNGAALATALAAPPLPDLLFLDINMPGLSGIEVLKDLASRPHAPQVILTTAYDHYALDGFNLGVADYLLKPYTYSRFLQALEKAQRLLSPPPPPSPAAGVLTFRADGHTERVAYENIIYLEALKDYTRLTFTHRDALTTLNTLTHLLSQLPAAQFMRIHRSYAIALGHVKRYNSQQVTLTGEVQLPVGKTYREELMEALSRYSTAYPV